MIANLSKNILQKIKTRSAFNTALVFLMLYVYSGYLMTVTNIVPGFVRVFGFIILLVSTYLIRKRQVLKSRVSLLASIDVNELLLFVTLSLVSLMLSVVHGDGIYYTAIFLIGGVATGFLVSRVMNYDEFIASYLSVLRIICYFSLMVYVLNTMSYKILSFAPTIGTRAGYEVKDLFFSVFLKSANVNRNYGIFWEPGAYQTFITLALFFSLFSKHSYKKHWTRLVDICMFIIALVTTKSTTAYITLFAILVLILFWDLEQRRNSPPKNVATYLAIITVAAIIGITIALTWGKPYLLQAFGKLRGIFDSSVQINYSAEIRLNAIKYPFLAFLSAPMIGIGFENLFKISSEYSDGMQTFTLLNWFTVYGIVFGTVCTVLYLKSITKLMQKRNLLFTALVCVILILIVASENYMMNPIMFALIFFSVEEKPRPIKDHDKEKKKLLFLLGTHNSANAVCSKKVIIACQNAGFDVTYIMNSSCGASDHENDSKIKSYRIIPGFYHRASEWNNQLRSKLAFKTLGVMIRIANKIKLVVTSPFWPATSPVYFLRYLVTATKLMQQYDFDAIVAIYCPIEALLVGRQLRKWYPEVKFIPYFLDALAGSSGPKYWSQNRTDRHTEFYERIIMKSADCAIVMESAKLDHQQRFENDVFQDKYIYLDIPLIEGEPQYEQSLTENSRDESNEIVVLFSGSLSIPQRNPVPILEVFKQVMKICEHISLRFVGKCNQPGLFSEYSRESDGRISYVGYMAREKAIEYQKRADFFLNIGNRNQNMVPSKIFEYMNYRKPIISTYSSDADSSNMYFRKYPIAYLLDERDSDYRLQAELLLAFINENYGKTAIVDPRSEFYLNTTDAFVKVITEIIGS